MTEILSIDLIDAILQKTLNGHTPRNYECYSADPQPDSGFGAKSEDRCTVSRSNALLTQVDCMRLFVLVLVDSGPFWFGFGFHLVGLFVFPTRGLVCHVARRCCSRRNYGQHRRSSGRLRRSCRTIGPATRSVETGEFPLKPLNLKHWPLTSWINLCQMLPTQLLDVQFFFPVRCQKIADWHCRRWKKSSPAWLGRKCLEFDFGVENGCALLKFLLQGHSKSMDLRGDNARLWGKTFVEIWWKLSQIE